MATTMTTAWACRQPWATAPRASGICSTSGGRSCSLFFGDDLGNLTARLASSLANLEPRRGTTTPASPASRFRVLAAAKDEEVPKKKKMSSAVKRALLSEKRRIYNKARKSEIRTRMKKVFSALEDLKKKAEGAAPEELKPVEVMIGEAYSVIDKAVKVRTLHRNTGRRRKSRLARAKKALEIALGWYDPASPAPPAVRPPPPVRSRAPPPAPAPAPSDVTAAAPA
ncbi:30S ribosomal protein S20, chloroplastic-like [Selaginella moellendorffii]|uniref:30S ribosomal protein S20, chloroplastic-like n=1 Tax=Selaginella moellendorffii TaxID=88036 RepID=UPI000D1D0B3E|nr:30S ribosomal protein S20, chloroplastic-like [Selaginella moellendorffii]|eukprot:XP_024533085.1 30S ribosomal protein S20, chloroplastic-like [Selaginella moellendorffii]